MGLANHVLSIVENITKQEFNNFDYKESVRAATTANQSLGSDFVNGDSIDGVTLATGDRISVSGTTNFNDDNLASQDVTVSNANVFTMTRSSSSSETNESCDCALNDAMKNYDNLAEHRYENATMIKCFYEKLLK